MKVEGKIFFSIVARRLTDSLSNNGYIDTSVQKGGIAGAPDCLEHTGVVTQLIREAQESKGDLAVLWLDPANAYGSVPHELVQTTLEKQHVPSLVAELIMDYCNQFSMRVSSGSTTSEWHRVEVGIVTGCTISEILFALARSMIVNSAEPVSEEGVLRRRVTLCILFKSTLRMFASFPHDVPMSNTSM